MNVARLSTRMIFGLVLGFSLSAFASPYRTVCDETLMLRREIQERLERTMGARMFQSSARVQVQEFLLQHFGIQTRYGSIDTLPGLFFSPSGYVIDPSTFFLEDEELVWVRVNPTENQADETSTFDVPITRVRILASALNAALFHKTGISYIRSVWDLYAKMLKYEKAHPGTYPAQIVIGRTDSDPAHLHMYDDRADGAKEIKRTLVISPAELVRYLAWRDLPRGPDSIFTFEARVRFSGRF